MIHIFHNWTKWSKPLKGRDFRWQYNYWYIAYKDYYEYQYQKRTCKDCGQIRYRRT